MTAMSLDDRLRAITLEHDSAARQRAYEALAREVMASVEATTTATTTPMEVHDGFDAFMDHGACDDDAARRRDEATRTEK
jgi:hypothetical protein